MVHRSVFVNYGSDTQVMLMVVVVVVVVVEHESTRVSATTVRDRVSQALSLILMDRVPMSSYLGTVQSPQHG